MKWLKEKPQTVTKLEQELHQVREQITQLKAREKELASKLKVEDVQARSVDQIEGHAGEDARGDGADEALG